MHAAAADSLRRPCPRQPPSPPDADETRALDLLATFGVPTVGSRCCQSLQASCDAAAELGYPVVLKTAEPGIDHKSDLGGVCLDLADAAAVRASYETLRDKFGPRVTVQQQIPAGVELAFGCVDDPDFGPLVMVAPGGTLVELFDERQFAFAPFGVERAEALIRALRVARLIDGVRGEPPRDMRAAAAALSAFSIACSAWAGQFAEIDVNPVVVTEVGAWAVDALVVAPQPEAAPCT